MASIVELRAAQQLIHMGQFSVYIAPDRRRALLVLGLGYGDDTMFSRVIKWLDS